MHTNLCNIDTLLDTKSELEKIYWELQEEERWIQIESRKLLDIIGHKPKDVKNNSDLLTE